MNCPFISDGRWGQSWQRWNSTIHFIVVGTASQEPHQLRFVRRLDASVRSVSTRRWYILFEPKASYIRLHRGNSIQHFRNVFISFQPFTLHLVGQFCTKIHPPFCLRLFTQVKYEGQTQYLTALCMGCLEGVSNDRIIHCRWDTIFHKTMYIITNHRDFLSFWINSHFWGCLVLFCLVFTDSVHKSGVDRHWCLEPCTHMTFLPQCHAAPID